MKKEYKYRIIGSTATLVGSCTNYTLQKRVLFFFWIDIDTFYSLDSAQKRQLELTNKYHEQS